MIEQKVLFKQLDKAEGKLLVQWDKWLQQSVKTIPWKEYERLQRIGGVKAFAQAPAPITINSGQLARILSDHAVEIIAAGRAHAKLLTDELHQQYRKRSLADDYPGFDFNYTDDPKVIPEKAIKAMESRSIYLAGDVDGSLLSGVKTIMVKYLNGSSRPEAEAALEKLLTSNEERSSLITTTETTYSYNRGRLAGFAENSVDYVRFSAIMDGRTSPICSSRHGLLMKMDDDRISANTPPLHGRCRSVLDPVYSAYQPELITDKTLDWNYVASLPKGWAA